MLSKKKTVEAIDLMKEYYPNAEGELNHGSDFQYLIAVMLSAQATDVSVNKATPFLFEAYPTVEKMAKAPIEDVMSRIKTIGLYKVKAKNIINTSNILIEKFNGEVPRTKKELVSLPGVGQKTANVVAGDLFNVPSIAVDTHVERISKRLRICKQSATVDEVEEALMKKIPADRWIDTHHTMILFGRYHCTARKPKCEDCLLLELCAGGQKILRDKEKLKAKK